MYKLFGSPGSASLAAHCMLEEVARPYEFIAVDISGDTRDPHYLRLNPHGRVPTLMIDGKPMFESAAICAYLADRHPKAGLAPAFDAPERATYMQWMMYLTNTVQELMLQMFYPERCTTRPSEAPHIVDKARARIDEAFGVVEKALQAGGPFLLGEKASAADIYLSMLAGWYDGQGRFAELFPAVEANRKLIAERPATAKAQKANG